MKRVIVDGDDGYKKAFWIKDTDTTVQFGIPSMPPDLDRLDWDEIKREIYNELVERNIATWQDIQREQSAVTGIVLSVVRNRIINLYKLAESEVKDVKLNQSGKVR